MRIEPGDTRLRWYGAVSVQVTEEWAMPWRLPHERRMLFPPDELMGRAAMPSGVRLAFRTDSPFVAGTIEPYPELCPIDLCCDGELVGSEPLDGKDGFRFEDLSDGMKTIELWLPQFGEFRLRGLEIADGAALEPFEDTRPKWITYGSSITHCRTAKSPAYTWPAIVARERGLNLTSFGFGGQCHLDPMVARLIRDLPADFISICAGINIQGGNTMNPRTFRPALIGTVQTIRDKHPTVPIALMSPIFSPPREEAKNAVGFNLKMMRREVAAAVEALREAGDTNVHYVDGLEVFGPELAHLLPDDLHPNAEGYQAMGRNFLDRVIARLFPLDAPGSESRP